MTIRLLLIGESLGRLESKLNHPLVWYSGWELARMLNAAELAPTPPRYPAGADIASPQATSFGEKMISYWRDLRTAGIAVTNVFNEHPEGDRTELFFDSIGEADLPSMRIKQRVLRLLPKYRHHVDRLYTEVATLRPNLVVAMGNFACWATLGTTGISAIRGTVTTSERLKVKCLATFHPAALRDESIRPTIIADLNKARRECEFPEIRRIPRWIVAHDHIHNIRLTLEEIRTWFIEHANAPSYSIDIETGYSLFTNAELKAMPWKMKSILAELITMISFADGAHHAVCIPFMTREDPQLNYWKTLEDEAAAWTIVGQQLASPIQKIFQNGLFDISVLLSQVRLLTRNATDDTMVLQHAKYAELRKGLGYLGSIHSDELAWKLWRVGGESIKRDE